MDSVVKCLHENLMSKTFRKTAVLNKNNCKLKSYTAKDSTNNFLGATHVIKFLQTLTLDFPQFVCNFPGKFKSAGRKIF